MEYDRIILWLDREHNSYTTQVQEKVLAGFNNSVSIDPCFDILEVYEVLEKKVQNVIAIVTAMRVPYSGDILDYGGMDLIHTFHSKFSPCPPIYVFSRGVSHNPEIQAECRAFPNVFIMKDANHLVSDLSVSLPEFYHPSAISIPEKRSPSTVVFFVSDNFRIVEKHSQLHKELNYIFDLLSFGWMEPSPRIRQRLKNTSSPFQFSKQSKSSESHLMLFDDNHDAFEAYRIYTKKGWSCGGFISTFNNGDCFSLLHRLRLEATSRSPFLIFSPRARDPSILMQMQQLAATPIDQIDQIPFFISVNKTQPTSPIRLIHQKTVLFMLKKEAKPVVSNWNSIDCQHPKDVVGMVKKISSNKKKGTLCVVVELTKDSPKDIAEWRYHTLQTYLFHIILYAPKEKDGNSSKSVRECLNAGATYTVFSHQDLLIALTKYQDTTFVRNDETDRLRKRALAEIHNIEITKIETLYSMSSKFTIHEVPEILGGKVNDEYTRIKDFTEKYYNILQRQKQFKVKAVVEKIEKYRNPVWEKRFWTRNYQLIEPKEFNKEVFHGTSGSDIAEKILKEGFRLPKESDQWFGPGIYFSMDTNYSLKFMNLNDYPKLYVCELATGKSHNFHGLTLTNLPKHLRSWTVLPEYDSVVNAAKRATTENIDIVTKKELYQDEYVGFNPLQAIIRYIVTFKTVNI